MATITKPRSKTELADVPLAKLVRHQANRTCDDGVDFDELKDSVIEYGQVTPVRVRPVAGGKYQIISGERRVNALRAAGKRTARCEIAFVDDSQALIELAVENSKRRNLDPIQRAELMALLQKPIEQGGASLTLLQAGAIFGIKSSSGCRNAVRLSQLPEQIKREVSIGAIPERDARSLVPLMFNKPEEIEKIERRLQHNRDKAISQIKRGLFANNPADKPAKQKPQITSVDEAFNQGLEVAADLASRSGQRKLATQIRAMKRIAKHV